MNNGFLIAIWIGIFLAVTASSCYYDIEEQLYPPVNCDTTATASYSSTVNAILSSNNCIGCHSGAGASAGIQLDNYNGVKAVAQTGKLYGSISHAMGYVPMPQGGGRMSDCDILKIKKWIDAGTINN